MHRCFASKSPISRLPGTISSMHSSATKPSELSEMADSPRRPPKRSRRHSGRLLILALLLLSAGAWAGGLLIIRARHEVNQNQTIQTCQNKLRSLRELRTIRQSWRSIIYVEQNHFLLGRKSVLFSIQHTISAGIDFSQGVEIQPLPNHALLVRLPPAQILSCDADERSIQQMFLQEGLLRTPLSMADYMPQIVAQGQANQQAALESGILIDAERNAQIAVSRILEQSGFSEIQFEAPLETVRHEF